MSRKVIYTCDRCSKECPNGEQLWKVGLHLAHLNYGNSSTSSTSSPAHEAEWCRECCAAVGIAFRDKPKPPAELPTPPTLEDMIREIIRQEIPDGPR